MKIVREKSEFSEQFKSAKREAKNHFGDDSVLIEKYLTKPRHIEVYKLILNNLDSSFCRYSWKCSLFI
jgi:acetyl/propionyl-CoA carboxylase alpha subunit